MVKNSKMPRFWKRLLLKPLSLDIPLPSKRGKKRTFVVRRKKAHNHCPLISELGKSAFSRLNIKIEYMTDNLVRFHNSLCCELGERSVKNRGIEVLRSIVAKIYIESG